MPRLAEIAEQAATGSVAATYADIRRVTGVPFVVFVYRVLATRPGRLEAVWAELAPNLASAEGRAARAELEAPPTPAGLAGIPPLPHAAVAAACLEPAAVAATLAGFRRTNAANVVGLWALLDGVAGREPAPPGPAAGAASTLPPGLPLADLAALPPTTVALLEEMSVPVAGGEAPVLVPSLFRCFAHDEALLRELWSALRPALADPSFVPAVGALAARGRALAQLLPYRVSLLDDEEARSVTGRFLRAIPAMLLVGPAIARAFALPPG